MKLKITEKDGMYCVSTEGVIGLTVNCANRLHTAATGIAAAYDAVPKELVVQTKDGGSFARFVTDHRKAADAVRARWSSILQAFLTLKSVNSRAVSN